MASGVVDKYIGESARVIREMFGYARDHQPCIIFMDEIDAIGGKRFSEGKIELQFWVGVLCWVVVQAWFSSMRIACQGNKYDH